MSHLPMSPSALVEQRVLEALPEAQRGLVGGAFELALAAHRGQTRDEGTPYIEHPVRVAAILAATGYRDAELLAAALLHDTIEDCGLTEAELARRFGARVARLVRQVSKEYADADGPPIIRFEAMSPEAKALKLADRLDNLRSLRHSPYRRKRQRMLEESAWRYLPLAREVGGRLGELFITGLRQASQARD